MKLKKIKSERRRLADEVYDQLLDAIHNDEIKANDRLVQEKLAADLQISRTPIREALLRLEQEGVLITSPRGGFVIRHMSTKEVSELYQARAAIEVHAARILAGQNDDNKNAKLRKIIEREENGVGPTVHSYFKANRNIHRAIVELSENRYLMELFDNIWNRGSSFQIFAEIEKIDISKSLGDHLILVEAIETGNLDTVTRAVIDHIEDGLELQIKALEHQA